MTEHDHNRWEQKRGRLSWQITWHSIQRCWAWCCGQIPLIKQHWKVHLQEISRSRGTHSYPALLSVLSRRNDGILELCCVWDNLRTTETRFECVVFAISLEPTGTYQESLQMAKLGWMRVLQIVKRIDADVLPLINEARTLTRSSLCSNDESLHTHTWWNRQLSCYLVKYFTFTVAKLSVMPKEQLPRTSLHSPNIHFPIIARRRANLQVLSIVQLWPKALLKLANTSLHTTKHHADTSTRKLHSPPWTDIPQTDVIHNGNKDNKRRSSARRPRYVLILMTGPHRDFKRGKWWDADAK